MNHPEGPPTLATDSPQAARRSASLYETCQDAAIASDTRTLESLVSHPEREVRRVLAQRTDLPDALNGVLARDPDWRVRQQLAMWHKKLPVDVFETLADDPSWLVRRVLPGNPHCPPSVVDRLSADQNPRVRQAAARSPLISPQSLNRLAIDEDSLVLQGLGRRWSYGQIRQRLLGAVTRSGDRGGWSEMPEPYSVTPAVV